MPLAPDFVRSLTFVHPRELAQLHRDRKWPTGGALLQIQNEIRPVDLYCYFGARFGQPNGLQNILRTDDSDNLIHWEWTLRYPGGFFSAQGHNFRTEFHFFGTVPWGALDKDHLAQLVGQIKRDFAEHGSAMGTVRKALESWVEFVNPYQRIRRSVACLLAELDALELDVGTDHFRAIWDLTPPTVAMDDQKREWQSTAARYSKGFGICFGIRSMLPILAESYVNLLLYMLMRPELKTDVRLRDNVFRQPIDVRTKSLAINCVGFVSHPDYKSDACKRYHSLVNDRNDLLHGNVVIDKLKFNDVKFFGTVPVFREYKSIWERSLGVEMAAVGLDRVRQEMEVVEGLIEYLTSCLDPRIQNEVKTLVESYELGLNTETQRLGILFPPWLVDFRVIPHSPVMGDENSEPAV